MPIDRPFRLRSAIAAATLATVLCTALATVPTAPAQAQAVQRIAAVVNDQIISLRDLEQRLDLVMATSNVPDSPQARRQFLPRVMRQLIDEQLKMQEAQRLGISVTDGEIDGAKRQIENNNNMPSGALDQILRRNNIPLRALEDQLRADVAWVKVVRGRLSRDLFVEPEEIDAVLETLRRNQGKPERLVSEIVLTTDGSTPDAQVRAAAERLVQDLRNGADFATVARQFSSAATAGSGGQLGWVYQGALTAELEQALADMAAGDISAPVRTTTGYTILKLEGRRNRAAPDPADLRLRLSQLYLPTTGAGAVPESTRRDLAATLRSADSCEAIDQTAEEMRLPSSGPIGEMTANDLPPPIRQAVIDLPENTLVGPIAISGAEVLIMVCERQNPDGLPSRQEIEDQLMQQKLERAAQRALRDLRNAALIDIRL